MPSLTFTNTLRKKKNAVKRKIPTRRAVFRRTTNRLRRLKRTVQRTALSTKRFATANNMRMPARVRGSPLTPAGLAFLKCAFAPPDFTSTQVQGIPDRFRGNSLLKKHRFNSSVAFMNNVDTYYVLAPAPGIAYFSCTVPAGVLPLDTTIWTGMYYSDFTSLFGNNSSETANVVTAFRFVSNHFELVPTVNQMTWSGSVSSWKIPLRVYIAARFSTGHANQYTVTGLQGVTSTNSNRFVGQFNDGVYGGCFSSSPDFDFCDVLENVQNVPTDLDTGDFGQLQTTNSIPGFDNGFESMVVKISGVTATQTAILRTWSCVEYLPSPNSSIYEYSTTSPPEDATAMRLYREICLSLPVGVPYRDNADFWKRVLSIIRAISGTTSAIPGPIGMMSGGLHAITSGIADLMS